MLSFEEPKKNKLEIAIVNGPDFDKNTSIYLHRHATEDDEHIKDTFNLSDYLAHKYNNEMMKKIDNETIKLGKYTDDIKGMISLYGTNQFSVSPDRQKGQTHFISLYAPPGSGKSTWISDYIRQYIKMNKKCKILYFSVKKLEDDKALNGFEQIQQIDMNDFENINNPIGMDDIINELEDDTTVLAIFDDCLAFDKIKLKSVMFTLKQFVEVGRSKNISVIFTAHSMSAGKDSKIAYDNSTGIVYFLASNKAKVEDQIIKRFSLKTDEARYLTKLKTRWICFKTSAPECIITEKQIIMLDDFRDHFTTLREKKQRRK